MPTEAEPVARPVVVTMGDPAGIGPDILLMTQCSRPQAALPRIVAVADPELLAQRARSLGLPCAIRTIAGIDEAAGFTPDLLPVIPVALSARVSAGKPDPRNAAAVLAAIEIAARFVIAGEASALLTNPIAKQTLYQAGFTHPGHTEFLGELAERATGRPATPVMMLVSKELRIVPATVHVPLRDVPGLLTVDRLVRVAAITAAALKSDLAIAAPRLAVAGLNPHAGEGGTIGREDEDVVRPAVEAMRRLGLDVTGPHSADTLFHADARKRYDCVIAMYHDQALIPLKTLAFDTGVNVTLGLPLVRTSPDHGTAFDIAGTGKASAASFVAALKLADKLARNRAASR
jgi:4-hydroxythreonine-4-phosphate dehydrogenase